jgi:hypothetical protein
MPAFKGTDFEIELPEDFSDQSTYAFAFPARSNFRPSLVVNTERLAAPTELQAYVEKQLSKIHGLLTDVKLVASGPVEQRGMEAYGSIYDWGEPDRRVRQKQRYILLQDPLRIVTLTGTGLQETFSYVEELFDAVFLSFRPLGQ